MLLFTIICACLCLAASISVNRDETDQFTEISIVINLGSKCVLALIVPMATESYPTRIRSIGYAWFLGFG